MGVLMGSFNTQAFSRRLWVQERAEANGADVDAVLACFDEEQELMGMHSGFDPFPFHMDMRMASKQKAMVEDIMRAFDEAGIDYSRLDVPYIQWDREDEQAGKIIQNVAEDHGYGMEMGPSGEMAEEVVVEEMTSDGEG